MSTSSCRACATRTNPAQDRVAVDYFFGSVAGVMVGAMVPGGLAVLAGPAPAGAPAVVAAGAAAGAAPFAGAADAGPLAWTAGAALPDSGAATGPPGSFCNSTVSACISGINRTFRLESYPISAGDLTSLTRTSNGPLGAPL